jgi:hypothetical protein
VIAPGPRQGLALQGGRLVVRARAGVRDTGGLPGVGERVPFWSILERSVLRPSTGQFALHCATSRSLGRSAGPERLSLP